MKIRIIVILAIFSFQHFFTNAAQHAVLVHNTLQDIEACKGKLQLKLIRVWGGDEEEDENKFFRTPSDVGIDRNNSVYICDKHNHCIKVFDFSGKYLRTIGRKGLGPGDVFGPNKIAFSPSGDLVVNEAGGRRIQWFNPEGKSKQIIKIKGMGDWIGVTAKNEIAFYDDMKSFVSKKLVFIYDHNGKVIREIGKYHDKSKSYLASERLSFSIDASDNIYAANNKAQVIRKYSPDGKLLMAITFAPPFGETVEISLNSKGDEIERKDEKEEVNVDVRGNESAVTIQVNKRKGKKRQRVGVAEIATDSQKRIYIITMRRSLTEKENSGFAVSGSFSKGLNRERVNFDIVKNIDVNRILVFSPEGRVIAEAPMTTLCDGIYIYNNRIFIIDGFYNQRILEYEMSLKK